MTKIVIFDIDGVIRDVSGSYRRAIADTVEHFTQGQCRPTMEDMDQLKAEGIWNNDWEASQELTYRYWESRGKTRTQVNLDYQAIVTFFQERYRGKNWDGYITSEPLLLESAYLEELTANGIKWGFFSGATRGSAEYILKKRLGLTNPALIAMEDAPGKPDPTGLFATVSLLENGDRNSANLVIYVGDTVADLHTVAKAREIQKQRVWIGVGVLPPHVLGNAEYQAAYRAKLEGAGAAVVVENVQEITSQLIEQLKI
jgi:HAD superfamily phosphatase